MSFNSGATRNQILDAILLKFKDVATWKTTSRKVKMWTEVPQESRPALYVTMLSDNSAPQSEAVPGMTTLDVTVFMYLWVYPDTDVPSTDINDVLDAFDVALAPSPLNGSKQTLGGLVSHCWKEGVTQIVPGDLDGDAIAVIPLKVLVPS